VSRPVKGSVPRPLWLALAPALGDEEEDAESAVAGAELEAAGVVVELDGAGELVELDEEGVDVVRLLGFDELEGCDPAEPPPFAHVSGSTYC
jgi:hypothetical protein